MRKSPFQSAPLYAVLAVVLFSLFVLARCQQQSDNLRQTQAAQTQEPVRALMYHHLLKRAENTRYQGNDIVTYVEDFAAQVAWLKGEGYHSITTAQLESFLYAAEPLPDKAVLFTFDDGYLSNFVYAYPILKEAGYTAVIFSVTGKIADTPETFRPTQINMQDRAIMEQCADVFEYASHTHDLHRATGRGRSALTDADPAAAAADLQQSLAVLAPIPGSTPRVFSYPYGFYTERVQSMLREQGVRLAFRATAGRLTQDSDPLALPRYPVSCFVSMETFQAYFQPHATASR